MARRTVVTLEDDLDGGPADETLRFGVDGSDYEIDLNTKNAAALHRLLAPFVARARRAGSSARRPVRTAASRRRSHDIRVWAMEQGIDLSDRGRIPSGVVDRYESLIGGTGRDPLATRPRRRRRLADGTAYPTARVVMQTRAVAASCPGAMTPAGWMPERKWLAGEAGHNQADRARAA
jgi:hypothetical protein